MWSVIIVYFLIFGREAISKPPEHFQWPDRIVGGSLAAEGSHPYMVALSTGLLVKSFVCGGSIIATRTVLTAAHCVEAVFNNGHLNPNLRLTLGTNQWKSNGQHYTVHSNVTHQDYSPTLFKNDLALLYASSAVEYNNRVRPIALSFDYVQDEVTCQVAGWGRVWYPYGPISDSLLELTVTTISEEQCIAERSSHTTCGIVDSRIELCVYRSPYQGMCQGDSGGALVRLDQGTQIGVLSWGCPCALDAPDIFVRLSAFEPWISMYTRY